MAKQSERRLVVSDSFKMSPVQVGPESCDSDNWCEYLMVKLTIFFLYVLGANAYGRSIP